MADLKESMMNDNRRTALLQEYGEVCSNFRTLTGIRFQLLAFLPVAAAAVAALRKDFAGVAEFALSLFGLVVTLALATYNERNNQLYNDLVQRAATIERSLGLPDGAFANRPGPWLSFQFGRAEWKVDHGSAVNLIYASSAALWLFGVLSPVLEWANSTWLRTAQPVLLSIEPTLWIRGIALVVAICIVGWAMSQISTQKSRRQRETRNLARKLAALAAEKSFHELATDTDFIADCARLAGTHATSVSVSARLEFYVLHLESLSYYMQMEPPDIKGAHIVALLTDLPPQWIFDCLTNRRGALTAHAKVSAEVVKLPV